MSLNRQFFKFVIPSIIAMWVFSIYTIVDGFFVANFAGEMELSAVTIVVPYVNFLFAIAIITGVGSQTIIGIELGKGNRDEANKVFTFIILFILAFSIVLSILGIIFMNQIIRFLGADSSLFNLSHQYLSVIVFFSPFYIIAYAFEVLVKVDGFPRTAIIGAVSACVTNMILDYILIDKFQMGVKGAALATGIAQFLSCLIFFIHFRSAKGYLRFVKIKMTASEIIHYLKTTVVYGFGEFISELNTATFVFIFNLFIIKYLSPEYLSAYAVINYMSLFANSTFQGVCHGTLPLLSYYHGSEEREKSLKIIKMSFIFIFIVSLIMYAIAYFCINKTYENLCSHVFVGRSQFIYSFTIICHRWSKIFNNYKYFERISCPFHLNLSLCSSTWNKISILWSNNFWIYGIFNFSLLTKENGE